jgi:HlyD family secretion protein
VAGVVLATYAERGELVQPGQPLYKVANLDTLTLRAYVSGAQLPAVRLGQPVGVVVDAGGDALRTLSGRVSWIASQAEFTPTPIQTREERTEQVYAVKVRVPNPDGALKIGMPGELVLDATRIANGGRTQ